MQIFASREANKILGWHALSKNDLAGAKDRLFSARIPVPAHRPSCYCFMDPLMKLLGWMLYRGQRQTVLEYLRRDQELVPEFRDRLAGWASEISQGLVPYFEDPTLLAENLKASGKPGSTPTGRAF